MLLLLYRSGPVKEHMTEPAKKNEFLSDLQLLDSGQMKAKVWNLNTPGL